MIPNELTKCNSTFPKSKITLQWVAWITLYIIYGFTFSSNRSNLVADRSGGEFDVGVGKVDSEVAAAAVGTACPSRHCCRPGS